MQNKTIVIEKILKQLTPERIKKENEAIQKVKLPPELQKWVKEYEKVGNRQEFIWKWLYRMCPLIVFPVTCFKKYQEASRVTKVLITMMVAQVDDASEEKNSLPLLEELSRLILAPTCNKNIKLDKKEKEYFEFTRKLWICIQTRIKRCPHYKRYKDIFYYDIQQVVNAIRYSYLVNRNPYLINKVEYWLYLPPNMTFMIYLMIDLMCAPIANLEEIGPLRAITLEAQKMGRISNWITTWERELENRDFSSGIFAYAIENGIITPISFKKNKERIKEKIITSNLRNLLLQEWQESYDKLNCANNKFKQRKIKVFLKGLEYLLFVDLASQGHK